VGDPSMHSVCTQCVHGGTGLEAGTVLYLVLTVIRQYG